MENIFKFINKCLTKLNNEENKEKVIEILEKLDTDSFGEELPEISVYKELKKIGEDDIAETFIYPIIEEIRKEIDNI